MLESLRFLFQILTHSLLMAQFYTSDNREWDYAQFLLYRVESKLLSFGAIKLKEPLQMSWVKKSWSRS